MTGYAYQLRLKDKNAGVRDFYVPAPADIPRIGDGLILDEYTEAPWSEHGSFPGHMWVEAVDWPLSNADSEQLVLTAKLPLVVATSKPKESAR